MKNKEREKALLEIIRQGLEICNKDNTERELGDRLNYLGISDIARYGQCPRAAMLGKIKGNETGLSQLLTLQRGHWFENGIKECLEALNIPYLHQLEIGIVSEGVPIKAHLDFTLLGSIPDPVVRILEVKSVDRLPEIPHEPHALQAQMQVNLLYRFWNEPVFNLRNCKGEWVFNQLTFPEICKKSLSLDLPSSPGKVSVENWLLYLSMKDCRGFGPYTYINGNYNKILNIINNALHDYDGLRNGTITPEALEYAKGFQPLCLYCQFSGDCPKFQTSEFQPQLEEALDNLDELKDSRTILEDKIREIEASLRQTYELSGVNGWVESGSHRFRVTNSAGRLSLDQEKLRNEIETIFSENGITLDISALFARCTKIGSSFSRLNIMKTK